MWSNNLCDVDSLAATDVTQITLDVTLGNQKTLKKKLITIVDMDGFAWPSIAKTIRYCSSVSTIANRRLSEHTTTNVYILWLESSHIIRQSILVSAKRFQWVCAGNSNTNDVTLTQKIRCVMQKDEFFRRKELKGKRCQRSIVCSDLRIPCGNMWRRGHRQKDTHTLLGTERLHYYWFEDFVHDAFAGGLDDFANECKTQFDWNHRVSRELAAAIRPLKECMERFVLLIIWYNMTIWVI